MIAIKLRPIGKKKQITYRIVVLPKKSKLVGEYIDDLGWYNPHTDKFSVDFDKAKKWIASGAQPTDTVHNILVTAKIIKGPKIRLQKKSKQTKQETSAQEAPAQEAPAQETPAQETPAQEAPAAENPAENPAQ